MLNDPKIVKKQIGDLELVIETGRMAKQADGSVLVNYGGNSILVTACAAPEAMEGTDFFPLTVNYIEKFYAAGKIPGGYLKREGRPSDNAILVSRLIDRPIRPLFPKNYFNEVQIFATTFANDQTYESTILGVIGASAALSISSIPFMEPAGGVRIIYLDGQYKVFPRLDEMEKAELDIVVAGTREGIIMVEGGAKEVSEEVLQKALDIAHETIKQEIDLIEELVKIIKPVKTEFVPAPSKVDESLRKQIHDYALPLIKKASLNADKHARSKDLKEVNASILEHFSIDKEHEAYGELKEYMHDLEQEVVRTQILDEKTRADGRKPDQIREIEIELDLFKATHGSALFTRGQTQSLGIVTLGTPSDVKYIDSIESKESQTKKFMLHYNFPPFSVGEVKRAGVVSRREIGHGHLAERAIQGILPKDEEQFPYILRIVSEVLESNGSSSMATVCSGSLALMAAGVPVTGAVAGIAMGLVWDKAQGKYQILSDIQGLEDHLGDMDFKVAGTSKGITAFQMDVKQIGITKEMMKEALTQANTGRMYILDKMNAVISEPRSEVADSAPKMRSMNINPENIGAVIGSGGKVIKKLMADFNVDIAVEDDGKVSISASEITNIQKALEAVGHIANGFADGEAVSGPVVRLEDYGVFVEVGPGMTGLLHVSSIPGHVTVKDMFQMGQIVEARVKPSQEPGKISLTQLSEEDEAARKNAPRPPRRDGYRDRDRGGSRDGRDRDRRPPRRDNH